MTTLTMNRLKQTAQIGDTDELYTLIREDKEALRWTDEEEFVDTPLHIAAHRGHANFAMAMMYLKPSCGRKLNEDMYSPIQIAVQNGHKDVVLGLLEVDKDLVRVKGREGYTALHSAAEEGHTDLLARFLKDRPACIEDVTIQNETALHVAAQNDRLEALEILARFLHRTHIYCEVSKRHILNSKDRDGNTVLHIAATRAQSQMVKLLLECEAKTKEQNRGGLTALNLLERQPETDEGKICSTQIRKARALNVKQMIRDDLSFLRYNISSLFKQRSAEENLRFRVSPSEQMVILLTRKMVNLSADKINALLVVLALILTATYQALLSPPGGVWQGDYSESSTAAERHVGQSVMDVFSFMIFHFLNFGVFAITCFLTVFFVQILSGSDVISILTELLLASLMWCSVIAWLVIQPTTSTPTAIVIGQTVVIQPATSPTPPVIGQALACLLFFVLFVSMEVNRRFLTFVCDPPIIAFSRKSSVKCN